MFPTTLVWYKKIFRCFFICCFLEGPQIVECLIQSIFFVRGLGLIKPASVEVEDIGLSYAKLNDPALDAEIKEQAKLFLDLQFAGKSTGEITVQFFEKKLTSGGWLISTQQEENVCWEKWNLRFRFVPARAQPLSAKEKAKLADEVRRRISFILKFVKTQHEHVPSSLQSSKTPIGCPYLIECVQTSSRSFFDLGTFLKK